jgi:hypothetical protein
MTNSTPVMACRHRGSARFRLFAALTLGSVLVAAPKLAFAETQVQGSPDAVRIEAQDSPIENVLTALGGAFDLRYRSSTNLDKKVTGTYQGPLRRVVARVLEGYNFVLSTKNGRVEVTVLGAQNSTSVAAAKIPNPATAKAAASPPPAASSVPSKIAQAPALPVSPPAAVANTKIADAVDQPSVTAMLSAAANSQLLNSKDPVSLNASGPTGIPAPAEIAALARRAGADLGVLRASLDRLPK